MVSFARVFMRTWVAFSMFGAALSASHAGSLDAHFHADSPNAGYAVHNVFSKGQSFTVLQSGVLDRISLQIGRAVNTFEPLIVELYFADPSGPLLASVSLSAAAVPVEPLPLVFTSIDLGAQSFPVVAGDYLVMVAKSQASGSSDESASYSWSAVDQGGSYPQGIAYTSETPFNAYTGVEWADFGFETYVSVPEPSAWILMSLGMAGLAWRGRARNVKSPKVSKSSLPIRP